MKPITSYLLFLTATPHRGDPENFRLLLDLLDPGFFADTNMLAESIKNKDNPLFLRRLKEDLKDFEKAPLFPPRKVETIKYYLSEDEKKLYNAVTEYVEKHFNRVLAKDKCNVTFALTILQRRLASSARAIRSSLERRYKRLKELYEKGQLIKEGGYNEDYIEDLEEKERWKKEEELLEKLTSAETLEELKEEIEKLVELVALAKEVEKKEIETKVSELRKVMDGKKLHQTGTKLRKWGYSVTVIHGGMDLDARIKSEEEFNNTPVQIMVSTEAGGEGINLQKRCWIMVNYDIPWNPNRLEQRMGRIHRYGQQHEVHIYNLVAVDTREGRILERIFDKLSQIQDHLGSDRVFDVIGEVLVGKSLKDLIVDAIANRRTMEEILKDFERIPDEEAIKKVRETSLEALATRHIDLTRILGEQRRAIENRLVPEYVEEFFKRAAEMLKIRMEAKISFDKEKAFKAQAEFVAMGHPLLEAEIRDGNNEIAGKRLFAVYQDRSNTLSFINPAVLWDLKPEAMRSEHSEIALDKDAVVSFVIGEGLENYKKELLGRRKRDADIKQKYGIRSLESMILDSEGKISEYETRRMKGENIPEATIQNEVRKKEDLQRKKQRLQRNIEAEVHLYPTDPGILGAVKVVPGKPHGDLVSDKEIAELGMNIAMAYENPALHLKPEEAMSALLDIL